jgi:hypothetical protein
LRTRHGVEVTRKLGIRSRMAALSVENETWRGGDKKAGYREQTREANGTEP